MNPSPLLQGKIVAHNDLSWFGKVTNLGKGIIINSKLEE